MGSNREDRPAPDEQAVREAMESLRGKSQSELFAALAQATQTARASGELSNTHMEEIYEKLSPMLTPSQRDKMREVILRLKTRY